MGEIKLLIMAKTEVEKPRKALGIAEDGIYDISDAEGKAVFLMVPSRRLFREEVVNRDLQC